MKTKKSVIARPLWEYISILLRYNSYLPSILFFWRVGLYECPVIEALLVHYTVGVFVLVFLSSQLERPSLLFFCRTFGDWSIPDNTLSSSLSLLDLHMDILGAVGSFFFFVWHIWRLLFLVTCLLVILNYFVQSVLLCNTYSNVGDAEAHPTIR